MTRITTNELKLLAAGAGYEYAALMAVINVESGGVGFAPDGKIIIQFEPSWFKRKSPYTPSGLWSLNKVERQAQEWMAFNDAFADDPGAAMQSTSIGMMQVMGFHYQLLGFKSVGEMWDYAKQSEYNQVDLAIRFIKKNRALDIALKTKNWPDFAYHYNGEKYKQFNYDKRLAFEYQKYL